MIYIFFTCLEIYPLYENYNSVIDFVIQVCIGTLNMTYLCFCHFENNHSSSFIFHTFLSVHPSQQKPVHADRCTMPVCCRHVIIDFRYWKKEADGLVERQKNPVFLFSVYGYHSVLRRLPTYKQTIGQVHMKCKRLKKLPTVCHILNYFHRVTSDNQ